MALQDFFKKFGRISQVKTKTVINDYETKYTKEGEFEGCLVRVKQPNTIIYDKIAYAIDGKFICGFNINIKLGDIISDANNIYYRIISEPNSILNTDHHKEAFVTRVDISV